MWTPPGQLDVPRFSVRLDGRALDDRIAAQLVAVSVEQSLELPGLITLELQAGDDWDAPGGWLDADQPFAVGGKVDLQVSLSGAPPQRLMHGEITALEAGFGADAPPRLTVRGHDLRHRLQRRRRVRTFPSMTDSDIAAKIGEGVGVTIDAAPSTVRHEYLIQANQTDFEFLTERARRIGFELSVADERLRFGPAANLDPPRLKLSMADGSLHEFRVRLGGAGQPTDVSVRRWDVKERKAVVARAGAGAIGAMGRTRGDQLLSRAFGEAPECIAMHPVASADEAEALARAALTQSMQALLQAEGQCPGNPRLLAGGVVGIDGVGRRYSGSYYVAEVRHRFVRDGGYTTRFSAWRNAL